VGLEFTLLRLTHFSNYAVRVLMYAAMNHRTPSAVPDIARAYGISYDHLKKAAAELCRLGYLETVRGRSGGVLLAKPSEEICLGEVIRQTEGDVILVECFDAETNTCPLPPACRLRTALQQALAAFFTVLDGYTLADLVRHREQLAPLIGLDGATPAEVPGVRSAGDTRRRAHGAEI
jgi:Rrf2 family transcriptional regulator, nitric oxide-sensitive transcriptional repressor